MPLALAMWSLIFQTLALRQREKFADVREGSVELEAATINMPDLGRGLTLGALYDAQKEEPVAGFLVPHEILTDKNYVTEVSAQQTAYHFEYDDTLQNKANMLDISAELQLSLLSGLVTVDGSAKYLQDRSATEHEVRMSTSIRLRTTKQTLNVFNPALENWTHSKAFKYKHATHVVTSVSWGANCIATFSKYVSNLEEKEKIRGFLKVAIKRPTWSVDGDANLTMNSAAAKNLEGVEVQIHGDVIPPIDGALPTEPSEALEFMRRIHTFGLKNGGVPMDLILTPLAWLDSEAGRLVRKLDASLIQRAVQIISELDVSEQKILDLLEVQPDGFLSWVRKQKETLEQLLTFRSSFTQDLSAAVTLYRNGDAAGSTRLETLFEDYLASEFSAQKNSEYCETQFDSIQSLKALISYMKHKVGVTVAEHYSEWMAPTLDQQYDKVYALVMTGLNPNADRSNIELIRRFSSVAMAHRQQGQSDDDSPDFCLAARRGGADECVENFAFVAIHFDSFCEQLCPKNFCNPAPRTCTDVAASRMISAANRTAWCENPCTMVLDFTDSQKPVRAEDGLPTVPAKPANVIVEGHQEAQKQAHRQKVTLKVSAGEVPEGHGKVRNWVVRTIWYEPVVSRNAFTWHRYEILSETRNSKPTIVVKDLVAGRRYSFAVAGASDLGPGPFSDETDEVLVAHNMAVITDRASLVDFPTPANRLPTWRSVDLDVTLSVPADEEIGSVVLKDVSGGGTIQCRIQGQTTETHAQCHLDHAKRIQGAMEYEVLVNNMDDDELAKGYVSYDAPSKDNCATWESSRKLFCNIGKYGFQDCVSDCASCASGEVTTQQFDQLCTDWMCEADHVYCPPKGSCLRKITSSEDQGCGAECGGGSVYRTSTLGHGVCAIPCGLSLPRGMQSSSATVLPGETREISCAEGFEPAAGSPASETFTCPQDNTMTASFGAGSVRSLRCQEVEKAIVVSAVKVLDGDAVYLEAQSHGNPVVEVSGSTAGGGYGVSTRSTKSNTAKLSIFKWDNSGGHISSGDAVYLQAQSHGNHFVEVYGNAGGGHGVSTRSTKTGDAKFLIFKWDGATGGHLSYGEPVYLQEVSHGDEFVEVSGHAGSGYGVSTRSTKTYAAKFSIITASPKCMKPTCSPTNQICVGYEADNKVYCYGHNDHCMFLEFDCLSDEDCSKYSPGSSPKFTDGDTPSCDSDNKPDKWRADACSCQA